MFPTDAVSSLNVVKSQLDESLKLAEVAIEQFLEEQDNDSRLLGAQEHLVQIKGVMKLLALDAAAVLVSDMVQLIDHVLSRPADRDHALGVLSAGVMVVGKYLDYVQLHRQPLPLLLVPTMNEVRGLLRREPVSEASFVELPRCPSRPPSQVPADIDRFQRSGKRLRHMYQVGLLGVVKGLNPPMNARIMGHALARIESLCGDAPLSQAWWIAQGVTESIAHGSLVLDPGRKRWLGALDRILRSSVTDTAGFLNVPPPEAWCQEGLFLVSLSDTPGPLASAIIDSAGLPPDRLTDAQLREERHRMFGPSAETMRSVVDAIREEIAELKERLDLGARGAQDMEGGFEVIAEMIKRIGNTLLMIGISREAAAMRSHAEHLMRGIATGGGSMPEFHVVADTLLAVENAVTALLRRYSATSTREGEASGISLTQIDDARRLVVAEARSGLSLAKRAISAFIDHQFDELHLANVPTTLNGIWGGLVFLQFARAAEVVRSCESFISTSLIRPHPKAPDIRVLETLADAISSVDYFLESIEDDKPVGEGILEIAEESLQELGHPVAAA